jgi:hypothetical protein
VKEASLNFKSITDLVSRKRKRKRKRKIDPNRPPLSVSKQNQETDLAA